MQTLFLFSKAFFFGKVKILSAITIITLVTSIYLSSIGKFSGLADILLTIGISFLAASLVAAFEAIKGIKASRLIRLLSIDISKKIVIVIPEFDKGEIVLDSSGTSKRISLSEIPSVSKTDFLTANYFVGLLQSHNIALPAIITDEEAINIIGDKTKTKEYKSFISIGLNSNKFSRKIAEKNLHNNIIIFDNPDLPNPGDKVIQVYESDNKFHNYTPNGLSSSDIALLLKVSCQHVSGMEDYSVVVCGGLNATGTYHLGELVYEKWNDIISRLKITRSGILKCKNYVLLFKVNGQSNTRLDRSARIEPHPFFARKF